MLFDSMSTSRPDKYSSSSIGSSPNSSFVRFLMTKGDSESRCPLRGALAFLRFFGPRHVIWLVSVVLFVYALTEWVLASR